MIRIHEDEFAVLAQYNKFAVNEDNRSRPQSGLFPIDLSGEKLDAPERTRTATGVTVKSIKISPE
jgi:hypothetical protein